MDIEHWNLKTLLIPSEITRLYERDILELVVNEANKSAINLNNENVSSFIPLNPENFLQKLKSILQKMHQNIKIGLKYLKLENTALFAFLYQNGRHKGEKFMQVLKKLVKCMKNWEEINLYSLINNHLQMFPSDFINIKRVRLPTTNSMHFLLSRLLGSYHLLMKTSKYCLQAAYYLRSKLLTGHFFANATVAFSFVARIRALSLDMAFTIAESFDEVHPILTCLFKVCSNEANPAFPCNLKDEFLEEKKGSNTQENLKGTYRDVECKNILDLNLKVEKDDNSNSESSCMTNIKKFNLDSCVSHCNSSKTSASNTNKRIEHDGLFSSLATFNENEDLGTYVSEKNFALIKKVISKKINDANKQMQNSCKGGMINRKQKRKKKKIGKLIK